MNAMLKESSQSVITDAMAAFAIGPADFPELARSRAVDAMVDCIGCMLAGSREPLATALLAALPSFDAPCPQAPALLLGTSRYATVSDSALFNGTIAHALDYDDTNHPAYAHPSAAIVPALLALAPQAKATGADMVGAYIAGFEIFGKLGRALNTQHYARGWHATGTFGAIAAAVAAGRLLRLNHHQMVMCLGIAASSASGLRVNFGSMTKPLHAGQAARAGTVAALFALNGFDASAQALDHRFGYLNVFNAGIGHDAAPLMRLGQDLEILTEHGLALKPFPSCGATHPGIEAALILHKQIKGEAIRSVRAGVCTMAFQPLIHVMPHAGLEGKFSLHYCVAAALLDGELGLHSFTDQKIADARIRALIPKINMEVDEDLRDDSEFATRLVVETESGARHECLVPLAMGKPARGFTQERKQAKFRECANEVLGTAACDAAFSALQAMDGRKPVSDLLPLLSAARSIPQGERKS